MEAAENLVLAPFRGIVDQGKRATANAHDSIAMLHALQSLVTEVEISLGLLEALCGKLIAAYGANFDDALKEHEEICSLRTELKHAIWDSDFSLKPEGFDAREVSDIRAKWRKAGQIMSDMLMKLLMNDSKRHEAEFRPHSPSAETEPPSLEGIGAPVMRGFHSNSVANPLLEGDQLPIGATDNDFKNWLLNYALGNCEVRTTSSFHIYKGFCEGANRITRGEDGVKMITTRVGFLGNKTVARCTNCRFELDFDDILADVKNKDKGDFEKEGVKYRPRFLQKSHVAGGRADDVLYACVFCMNFGHSLNECDPTIFSTAKSLLRHISHHPRPLSKVDGIVVVEGPEMPAHLRNDYDVHLIKPKEPYPMDMYLGRIARLPKGVAKATSRSIYGQRRLFDGSPSHEICQGATVTGITWPDKYHGEWMFAWHDGAFAAVPSDIITLISPPYVSSLRDSSSSLTAQARWDFTQLSRVKGDMKKNSLWLSFKTNDLIHNITYVSDAHWCWSGIDGKGNWGLFPREFLDLNSIEDGMRDELEGTVTKFNESSKSASSVAKFSRLVPSANMSTTTGLDNLRGLYQDYILAASIPLPTAAKTQETGSSPADLQVPDSMHEALAYPSTDKLVLFLQEKFELAARGEYAWIADLHDVGYTHGEIAQLVYERAHDSPWIFFEPSEFSPWDIIPDHHLSGCAHFPSSARRDIPSTQDQDREVMLAIQELCGLGGVRPTSREKVEWDSAAEFEDRNSVVTLYYSVTGPGDRSPTPRSLVFLAEVADRLAAAVRVVQDAGYCCDSFTILLVSGGELQLRRIKFELVQDLTNCLRRLRAGKHLQGNNLQSVSLLSFAQRIVTQALGTLPPSTDKDSHHAAALALQILCVGFLSYAQAHIGMLQPFFLDTPLQRLYLVGTSLPFASVVMVRLVELTCLAGLCQGPVLAFEDLQPLHGPVKYDVRACPADILDTWGPGELVARANGEPCAIRVGEGFISSSPQLGEYHWDRKPNISSPNVLALEQEILIGTLVMRNPHCPNDEGACWEESLALFEELGTYKKYFETLEYQLGLQGGPDHLNLTFNKTWVKRRGKTVKARNLELQDSMLVPFLECYWGVKVSFCTGVAQRVPLRQLIADLLPAFTKSLVGSKANATWTALKLSQNVLFQFREGLSIRDWLCSLEDDECQFVLGLIRLILGTLQDTGISRDGTHFLVSWPYDGTVNRCFRIPLGEDNKWAPMLADSDDCATFAYISNECLEARTVKCRGPNPSWQDRISLLETSVLCPASSELLKHQQTYFFHKMDDDLLWVRCTKGNVVALVRLDSIRSLPSDVKRRLMFYEERKKQRRIRERDLPAVRAETVSVLSQSSAYKIVL